MSHTSSTRSDAPTAEEPGGATPDGTSNGATGVVHRGEHRGERLTIGVRDSGVGGLTVARRIKEALPHARLLYFADTIHVPYGGREPDEVRHFALSIADFLVEEGAHLVVFACNTSSAVALESARETLSVPVVGTIEPGARAANAQTVNNRIGVLATQTTVESAVYTQHIEALNSRNGVLEIACPRFVPLVESEQTESDAALEAAREYLRPLVDFGADTIVLGCTHYPLLMPVLQRAARELGAPHLYFVDPAQAVADDVQSLLCDIEYSMSQIAPDEHTFFVSGESDGVRHWVQNLLNIPHPRLEIGPIF